MIQNFTPKHIEKGEDFFYIRLCGSVSYNKSIYYISNMTNIQLYELKW